MKGVGGITAVRRRIDQRLNHLLKFDDRAGPAMGDDERQRRRIFRAYMDEVDVEPVDLADELVKAIEPSLARAPIICIGPVLADVLNPFQRRALAPVTDRLRIRPAGALQSRSEIGEHIVADIDAERPASPSHRLLPISTPCMARVLSHTGHVNANLREESGRSVMAPVRPGAAQQLWGTSVHLAPLRPCRWYS